MSEATMEWSLSNKEVGHIRSVETGMRRVGVYSQLRHYTGGLFD